jgi:hypothetical protein
VSVFARIGDALLTRLLPTADAHACVVSCGGGCDSYLETSCSNHVRYYRCCYMANGSSCTAPYCDDPVTCGEYC